VYHAPNSFQEFTKNIPALGMFLLCCAAFYLKVDRNNKTAYTLGTMKFYKQKIAVFGLIVALAYWAGWFCVNPQGARMMESSSAITMLSMLMVNGDHYMDGVSHSAWSTCVFNCLSKSPQILVAKKFSIDAGASFLPDVFDNQTTRLLADSSGLVDFSKTRPPAPDILSSVFKKE
jgi:hypothetical protein